MTHRIKPHAAAFAPLELPVSPPGTAPQPTATPDASSAEVETNRPQAAKLIVTDQPTSASAGRAAGGAAGARLAAASFGGDETRAQRMFQKLLERHGPGPLGLGAVWELTDQLRRGGLEKKDIAAIHELLAKHGAQLTQPAKIALEHLIGLTDPGPSSADRTLWELLWATSEPWALAPKPGHWRPFGGRLGQEESPENVAKQAAIFAMSNEQAQKETLRLDGFFRRYPSTASNLLPAFQGYWAAFETLDKHPLQALLYHHSSPMDEAGQPKNAFWQAYVDAIDSGQSPQMVDEIFLRAHIQDFKNTTSSSAFKAQFALVSPWYQKVVESYVQTLIEAERDMNAGQDATHIARAFFPKSLYNVEKFTGTTGMIFTKKGFEHTVDAKNPISRAMWSNGIKLLKNVLFGAKENAPTKVMTELSASEAAQLTQLTGIRFEPGRHLMSPDRLAFGSVAATDGTALRLPLTAEDFLQPRPLHRGERMAGADNIMQAEEVLGVVRQVRAKARSQLVHEFNENYPVPAQGLLVYSANMLALNGAYGESDMFDTLAQAIMPVKADGTPKNALWQQYVDAYEAHKASGSSSKRYLQSLWLKAHMADFAVVDSPDFKAKLDTFWSRAISDPALQPMAIYTKAMVLGRTEFDKATQGGSSEEVALYRSFEHAVRTLFQHRTLPFWQQDLRALKNWVAEPKLRRQPDTDARGLATEKALLERSANGVATMLGLSVTLKRGALRAAFFE